MVGGDVVAGNVVAPLHPGGTPTRGSATLPAAGATVGVEEEFHLVDPGTFALASRPELAAAAARGEAGGRVHAEIATTQLETVTRVCTTLADVREELRAARAEAAVAAARAGAVLLAASTHPFSTWREQRITAAPRYEAMVERWAGLVLQQDICGCHVHVGVPDLDTAVAVMDRARPYLPVLLAMTGSSPFHDGVDTGYASYRTVWWSRWPMTGIPEHFGSADRYREVVDGMVAAGVIADASNLYWDVRPSSHLPTLEFRLADVCTDLDAAVLHAALCRSLVRVLAERARRDLPCPQPRPELLRAARWRAARSGLDGQLFDPLLGALVDARVAVRRLLAELEPDLRAHDEYAEVVDLVRLLMVRGTSAARQRRTWQRTGDARAVAEQLVRQAACGGC
ncbi:glutamate--cysteine ligase [Geodermatophilus sp. YIM 151500]|uniref:carboxylate-amine ligase n=1 Tax=Geodermatophilus sp. YIM 151500 TaxID=2984531 RepID=UPI0021E43148|nr:glutamate--cysteine ligase [Geodermatophilus sp. YIM 151500]MCV2488359.1 glutamate--cysteine ligase [Geodermatophilus sp. YIM 151500]